MDQRRPVCRGRTEIATAPGSFETGAVVVQTLTVEHGCASESSARSRCCGKVLQNMGLILTQEDTFYYLPAIPFFSYFGNGVLAGNLQTQIYVKFKAKVVEFIRS